MADTWKKMNKHIWLGPSTKYSVITIHANTELGILGRLWKLIKFPFGYVFLGKGSL